MSPPTRPSHYDEAVYHDNTYDTGHFLLFKAESSRLFVLFGQWNRGIIDLLIVLLVHALNFSNLKVEKIAVQFDGRRFK